MITKSQWESAFMFEAMAWRVQACLMTAESHSSESSTSALHFHPLGVARITQGDFLLIVLGVAGKRPRHVPQHRKGVWFYNQFPRKWKRRKPAPRQDRRMRYQYKLYKVVGKPTYSNNVTRLYDSSLRCCVKRPTHPRSRTCSKTQDYISIIVVSTCNVLFP